MLFKKGHCCHTVVMIPSGPALRVVCIVALAAMASTGPVALASASEDGSRTEEVRYVATPHPLAPGGTVGAAVGLGRVSFDIFPGESSLRVTIADAVFPQTEVTAIFGFDDAPIRVAITFCRQHTMSIPGGATDVTIVLQPLLDEETATCGGDPGATAGTVNARFF